MIDFLQALALSFFILTMLFLVKRLVTKTIRPGHWWAAGTRVILVEQRNEGFGIVGTAPIQRLLRGQHVLSFNPQTGETGVGIVTHWWSMTPIRLTLYEASV